MSSNADVMKVVQEAVRQYGQQIQSFDGKNVLPAIVTSNAPPEIKVVSLTQGKNQKDSVELSHRAARAWSNMYAVCVETWDGYVTLDGVRTEAILVNYWTDGRGPVFFAQRYKRNPFEWIGAAIPLEDAIRI